MNGIVFYIVKTDKEPETLIQALEHCKSCYYGISENCIYISRKEITVDSGQVGFFDFTFYKNYSDNQKIEKEK